MKYNFILMICFISFLSKAQTKITIEAGTISTNNYIVQPLNYVPSYQNYLSFDLGVLIKQVLCKKINSESGIFYYPKGYKFYSRPMPDNTYFGHNHVNYITLNQNFYYNLLNLKQLFLITGIGGFIGKGVSGKYVQDSYTFGGQQHYEGKINFGNTTKDQFQSLDAGLNFLLRFGYRKFDVTAMFSPSVTNHIPKASRQSVKEKLQSVSINLGYNF